MKPTKEAMEKEFGDLIDKKARELKSTPDAEDISLIREFYDAGYSLGYERAIEDAAEVAHMLSCCKSHSVEPQIRALKGEQK